MSNVVKIRGMQNSVSFNILDSQKNVLEKEVFSLAKNIDTNMLLIQELEENILNLKKERTVVSLNEYRKILSELSYLRNNLAVLKGVHKKNESDLKSIKKITEKAEGRLIKIPIKKTKRSRSSKKDSL